MENEIPDCNSKMQLNQMQFWTKIPHLRNCNCNNKIAILKAIITKQLSPKI